MESMFGLLFFRVLERMEDRDGAFFLLFTKMRRFAVITRGHNKHNAILL